jgi:hypothetical protein
LEFVFIAFRFARILYIVLIALIALVALIALIADAENLLHDVEVLMRGNYGRRVVVFAPVCGDYTTQDLAGDAEKVLFIFHLVDANP